MKDTQTFGLPRSWGHRPASVSVGRVTVPEWGLCHWRGVCTRGFYDLGLFLQLLCNLWRPGMTGLVPAAGRRKCRGGLEPREAPGPLGP